MIIGVDKKELQKKRELKYNEYVVALNSENPSNDEIIALRSELKYFDDQLNKINGLNDKKRIDEVKKKKNGTEEKNRNNYYAFKAKYKQISNMSLATTHIIGVINKIEDQKYMDEKVKVKVV